MYTFSLISLLTYNVSISEWDLSCVKEGEGEGEDSLRTVQDR